MPNLTLRQKVFLGLPRKGLGYPLRYGQANFGISLYGDNSDVSAVFQRRFTSHVSARSYGTGYYGGLWYGEQTGILKVAKNGKRKSGLRHISMKFYRPTNPQTIPQQALRGTFADGVANWQGLTTLEKVEYNNRAKGKKMSGYNLFLREYMLSN